MSDRLDFSDSIKPKSDQLNADDMLAGPMTITITKSRRGSADQPCWLFSEGQQPFKPCKSVRRILIKAWGKYGADWVGKSLTLYCDADVKFAGSAVGGIRISHMSHIDQPIQLMLTASRGRKAQTTVQPLVMADPAVVAHFFTLDEQGRTDMWGKIDQATQSVINEQANSQPENK